MRRLLGLTFLLGAFACVGSAERALHDERPASEPGPMMGAATSPIRGTSLTPRPRSELGQASTACSSNVTLHGSPGAVISQPSVVMLFWGGYWSSDAGATERQQYTTTWSTIASDPAFYARLAEYSTSAQAIGTGSFASAALADTSLSSGTTITETQIQQEIASEIAAGTAPALTASRIYVVMIPPGVTSQLDQQDNFAGHHAQFTPSGGTQPVRYAVITYNTDQGYNDPVISHELSEATTDPDVSTGWWNSAGEEIGDLCRFNYTPVDGYTIEEIWSNRTCGCVGVSSPDAGVPDASVTTSCSAPAWDSSATYVAGNSVSFAGNTYTAAYWNQNDEPDTHSGPSGSGQPWQSPVPCTTTTCVPSCTAKQCGSDGCGGSCGTCGSSDVCNASNQCVPSCLPSCDLKQCGSDGCGGSCGQCGAGLTCNPNNQCVAPCVPQCSGKQCGGDTCGGSCGTCPSGETCSTDGTCQGTTTSSCTGLTPWDPNQPWYGYSVGEQHVGSNGHRYTCKNVAYCIDDPTGAVGGTYGWTDDGPC